MSKTHDKNLNHSLNLFINFISARSLPQILFPNVILFSSFLINALCKSFANSLLDKISFLSVPLEFFYPNIYRPFKQELFDIHHISDIQQY